MRFIYLVFPLISIFNCGAVLTDHNYETAMMGNNAMLESFAQANKDDVQNVSKLRLVHNEWDTFKQGLAKGHISKVFDSISWETQHTSQDLENLLNFTLRYY